VMSVRPCHLMLWRTYRLTRAADLILPKSRFQNRVAATFDGMGLPLVASTCPFQSPTPGFDGRVLVAGNSVQTLTPPLG
jgi:hypothetical protein